jgi:hypothetical protein
MVQVYGRIWEENVYGNRESRTAIHFTVYKQMTFIDTVYGCRFNSYHSIRNRTTKSTA